MEGDGTQAAEADRVSLRAAAPGAARPRRLHGRRPDEAPDDRPETVRPVPRRARPELAQTRRRRPQARRADPRLRPCADAAAAGRVLRRVPVAGPEATAR